MHSLLAVISPHLAPSTPSYHAAVQSQSGDAGSPDSNGSGDSQPSSSFAQLLAQYSNPGDEGAEAATAKAPKQTPDGENKGAEDAAAAAAAAQTAAQASLSPLAGLLGLLRQQQAAPDGAEEASTTADAAAAHLTPKPGPAKGPAKQVESKPVSIKHVSEMPVEASTVFIKHMAETPGPQFNAPADVVPVPGGAAKDGEAAQPAKAASAGAIGGTPAQQSGSAPSVDNAAGVKTAAPMAFSMLISGQGGSAAAANAQTASESADAPAAGAGAPHISSAAITSVAVEAASKTAEHSPDIPSNATANEFVSTENRRASEDASGPVEQPGSVQSAELEPGANVRADESVRNMRVQLEGDNNQRVDVRLTDVGGELRVNVRSADTNLTQALQEHMPELTNRLEQQHFRAEVWIPRTAESSEAGASNTRNFHSPSGDTSGQQHSGRRQNGRQDNQPDWLEEDIPSQTGTKETSNQIWLQ